MKSSTSTPPPLHRRLGLGRLLYLVYHYPIAWIARSRREGGPINQGITARGRRAMEEASRKLTPVLPVSSDSPEIYFLTGRRFWYQTAFCFWSLRRHTEKPLRLVLVDDGTIDSHVRAECERIFPGSRIAGARETEDWLDTYLPVDRFPTLREQRAHYLHLRKLTDVHVGREGWKLVLDSDMLFFRRPEALLAWLAAPSAPLHMLDIQNAYGYPETSLAKLTSASLPQRVNVGVLGLQSESIDWEQLESWCAELIRRHGTSYYLEQALCALLLSSRNPTALPGADYLLMPGVEECRSPRAILHHYVAESKRGYFRHAWRLIG